MKIPAGLSNDLAMVFLLVMIIALMILPLPTMAIDSLLAINITVSLLLLITTLFIPNAIALSSFPSLLLFTTLFRLSLNIASSKAILLKADAGHLIESFGELVVGGNLVVGITVFLIITVVQFVVISKGTERVAEVGARFTLDAMPGKQMSIDADLRAGILTADEARRKRAHLAMESQMHGGMDGAMKFVKGDAIAGLVITMVNMLAGVVVGVMYHAMSAGEAANRFTILSIGDAMVSQIPSLFICVAAGVLITRVADEHSQRPQSLGQEIIGQLTRNDRALYLAALVTASFGFVPGFPTLQFLALAAGLTVAGRVLSKRQRKTQKQAVSQPMRSLQRDGTHGDPPSILTQPPQFSKPLAVRMSPSLAQQLHAERLNQAIVDEKLNLQTTLGVPFPGISMWVDDRMTDLCFDVLLNDVPQCRVAIPQGMLLVEDENAPVAARATRHGPAIGRQQSLWIAESQLAGEGRTACLDVEQVLARHVMQLLRAHAHQFMGVQEAQWVLEKAGAEYSGLVAELQKLMSTQRIAEVLRRLLEEHVPIRNVRSIFESLIAWGPKEKDILLLTEYVRCDLGGYLAYEASGASDHVLAILLDPHVEQSIRQCIKPTPSGNYLAMPPEQMSVIVEEVSNIVQGAQGATLSVVTSMDIRRYVRIMVESRFRWLRVYSYQELSNRVELRPLGRVVQ